MTIGVGVAGLASYYSTYYANRAMEHPDTTVAGGAQLDATDEQLEALGRYPKAEFGNVFACPVYDSIDDLLAANDVDVVILGSLLHRRADDAVAILDAGRPVLTGKPAAASASDAERIADAAREDNLVAATTAPHRHDGRIQQAQKRVERGEIGDVCSIRATVYHGMASPDGIEAKDGLAPDEPGPAYTMGYYTADLVRWFAGDRDPHAITGSLENTNSPFMAHPDVGSATVSFADTTIATMTYAMCNAYGPGYGWEIEVHGTEGTIRTDQRGHEGMQWSDTAGRTVELFGRTLDPVLDHQFDRFISAVIDESGYDGVAPGPDEAAAGIALCDAWVEAATSNQPITL